MSPDKMDDNCYDDSLKAHLRDSIRTARTLKRHLSRETLPSVENYHSHSLTTGGRATLDELHLGQLSVPKVSFIVTLFTFRCLH